MTWYSAHIVMFVEFKEEKQDRFPAWENIVLLDAATEEEAYTRAEELGRRDEGDDGGTFRWGKQPARWVFAGVRKLTECVLSADRPGDGDEVSSLELQFKTKKDLNRFVSGKSAMALVDERYRLLEVGESEPDEKRGTDKKRPA